MQPPRIFISSWSIKKAIEDGSLDIFQLPELAATNDFQGVEIIDRHLPTDLENAFRGLGEKIESAHLQCTLGITTNFVTGDSEYLKSQIEYAQKMISRASLINAMSLRILLGGHDFIFQRWMQREKTGKDSQFNVQNIKKQKKLTNLLQRIGIFHILHKLTIQAKKPRAMTSREKETVLRALDELVPLAEKNSVPLAIENHWGITTLPENILFFVDHYSSEHLGCCVDVGNFSRWQDRYREMEKLLPHAREIHAKSYSFDEQGEEKTISYQRVVPMIKMLSPHVPLVIEYEGAGDQFAHTIKTQALINRHWQR